MRQLKNDHHHSTTMIAPGHVEAHLNGRILDPLFALGARERRIYDFTGLLVQLGVLKAKPA